MNFEIIFDFLAALAGVGIAFYGFRTARKIRLIKDIPTSKIRSVAMGISEIKGRAVRKEPLESRILKIPCVYFRFLIEAERRDAKGNKYWQKIDGGESANYFYVEDDTGRILVDPLGAEVILPYDYRYVDYKGTINSGGKVRYTEWRIEPGEEVYVLGTVGKFVGLEQTREQRLAAKIRELKADRQKMKECDRDGDGTVSPHEWDEAVRKMEEEIIAEDAANAASPPAGKDDIVVSGGDVEKTFIISDHSERELCRRLAPGMYASVFVGFCIIILSFASALARAGLDNVVPAVPWGKLISLAGRIVL